MSLQVELKIDPKDVEKQVTEAIIASSFGEQLKSTIDEVLKNFGNRYSWDNELRKWVDSKMKTIAWKYIEEHHTQQIEEAIRKYLAETNLDELVKNATDTLVKNMKLKNY